MSVFPFMIFLFFANDILQIFPDQYNAHLPGNITALSGSCVEIPCVFDVIQSVLMNTSNVSGSWIKTNHSLKDSKNVVVYNGSTNTTNIFSRIEIIGDLRKKDCTTIFYDVTKNHSDNYFFRVEKPEQNSWIYSYVNPVNISVSDIPQTPILNPASLQVMEGSTVNLSCSAEAPCPKQPPTISLSNISESANISTKLLENSDKTKSVFTQMTFNASYKDHRKNISCTVTYPRKTSNDTTVETIVMLKVMFPPKETFIIVDPSASVSAGTNVTLTCRSTANPSDNINYTWYQNESDKQLTFGEKLNLININKKNEGMYFCKAETTLGHQESDKIQLTVTDAASQNTESLYLIIACVGGVSLFLFLFLLISLFLRVQRVKKFISRETDPDQDPKKDVPTSNVFVNSAFVPTEEPEMPNTENDNIHYGEIDFSCPKPTTPTVQKSGLETIYAEVYIQEKIGQD